MITTKINLNTQFKNSTPTKNQNPIQSFQFLKSQALKSDTINFTSNNLETVSINKLKKICNTYDEENNNIFHKASFETLKSISKRLPAKKLSYLICKTNRSGDNAFHTAMFDKDKIKLFCEILTKARIKKCIGAENGFNISPLKNFPVENLEIMLECLSKKDIADICLSHKYRNNNNIFHKAKADRIELLCQNLEQKDIKKLCQMQNRDGDTPFHTLDKDSIKVLMEYLSEDEIQQICTIKNKKGQTPLDC